MHVAVGPKQSKKTLFDALRRHSGQRTVLFVALPILRAHIESVRCGQPFVGLTERQIAKGFRELAAQFGNSDYHPTYVQRRLGPLGFLELNDTKYRFRAALVDAPGLELLEGLAVELTQSLRAAFEQRQALIRKLEDTVKLPNHDIQQRRALVTDYLNQITGSGGEMFEVVSFAVLREYFRTFGFSLQ